MKIQDSIDYFITEQTLRGNTAKTIKNYRSMIGWFIDYIKAENLEDVTIYQINKYHLHLRDKGIKGRTIQTYLRHIRVFLNFCHKEQLIETNIAEKLTLPKAEKPIFEILTSDEISYLLSIFSKSEMGMRNLSICWLMLDCGLRIADVCNMKISDINFSNGYIHIEMGKGQKGRIVPVGLRCRKVLTDYLYKRRLPMNVNSELVFLNRFRCKLTEDSISLLFTRLKKRTGIARLHAHLLRHTFATNFLLDGQGDIYQLSQILGHTDIKTTQIYLHAANYYKIIQKSRNNTYMDKNFK